MLIKYKNLNKDVMQLFDVLRNELEDGYFYDLLKVHKEHVNSNNLELYENAPLEDLFDVDEVSSNDEKSLDMVVAFNHPVYGTEYYIVMDKVTARDRIIEYWSDFMSSSNLEDLLGKNFIENDLPNFKKGNSYNYKNLATYLYDNTDFFKDYGTDNSPIHLSEDLYCYLMV